MRGILAFLAALAIAVSTLSGSAQAATEKASFAYHIGDGFGGVLNNTGNTAVAENGDTVTLRGNGTFDVVAKTATGGGTFTHKRPDGSVFATGTWSATGLLAFQSYGDATPQGLPASFFGGRAALTITGMPAGTTLALPGILEIECLLGNPPGGAEEGVRLLVKGVIHFNKSVHESGENVYVKL
ncbi:MAG TPA: hypothetical protein VGR46_06970 [Candidatus Limnocylindria bacterium]|nr:hypothetical protein [Candidatus Limnocylindria bacterium]